MSRAHYNLACYYSSQADYSNSIGEPELALSGLDAGWKRGAQNDDSLSGVKEYKSTSDEFRRVVSVKAQ
jgi:hypothetical protein